MSFSPNIRDNCWKDTINNEDGGRLSSILKGLDMDYVRSIPITGRIAETMSSSHFKDPYFVAKKAIVNDPRSPQFEKKNVFGHFKIQTIKERGLDKQMSINRRYSMFTDHNANVGTTSNTPRKDTIINFILK